MLKMGTNEKAELFFSSLFVLLMCSDSVKPEVLAVWP